MVFLKCRPSSYGFNKLITKFINSTLKNKIASNINYQTKKMHEFKLNNIQNSPKIYKTINNLSQISQCYSNLSKNDLSL